MPECGSIGARALLARVLPAIMAPSMH